MTGRGRPRREESPDLKLTKSRAEDKSPPRHAAFAEEKQNQTTKGPKKQDQQKPNHTEEKPSVQKTRKGKSTNHFVKKTVSVSCCSSDSTRPKTCSATNKPKEKSAGETKETQPCTPKDLAKVAQKIPKTRGPACQPTLLRENAGKTGTQPETLEGTTETCGIRAKGKDTPSDENKTTQPETLKDIRRASAKHTEAKARGKAKMEANCTKGIEKTEAENFTEEIKPKIPKKTKTAVEETTEATQKTTKTQQETSEDCTKHTPEKKVDKILHMTLNNLTIKRNEKSQASETVNEITKRIIKHLKENTVYFKDVEEPLRTGSYYENVKISNPDEFDVMLPIPIDRVQTEPFGNDGAFYSVRLKRGKTPLQRFEENGILSGSKMLEEFRNEVKICLKECQGWEMTRKKRGCPAVTLTTKSESVTISLDFVLCLMVRSSWPPFTKDGLNIEHWLGTKVKQEHKRKPYYLVPKYEGKGTVENDGILAKDVWRVSFSHVEKAILKNHGSDKTCCEKGGTSCCRKDCLKLVKHLLHLLKENNTSFNKFYSYHAKTMLLHACCSRTSDTDWKASDLSRCFKMLLQDFENHLRRGMLCNFFIPTQNLLSGPGSKMCEKLADCIKEQRDHSFPIFQEDLNKKSVV